MKSLEEEAKYYAENDDTKNYDFCNQTLIDAFWEGANSKYVQAQIIREKMSLLAEVRMYVEESYYIDKEYDKLCEQLKQLEDGE